MKGVNNEKANIIDNKCTSTGNLCDGVALGIIPNNNDADLKVCCTNYISGGDSESPIYYSESYNGNNYYTVIGIVSSSSSDYMIGARIDSYLLKFYLGNPNL